MYVKESEAQRLKNVSDISHVGGVNDQLGGVDPDIDEDLMRLSGSP